MEEEGSWARLPFSFPFHCGIHSVFALRYIYLQERYRSLRLRNWWSNLSVAKILQRSLWQALGSLEEAGWRKEPWRLAITWMVSQLPGAIPPYAPESVGGTDVRRYSGGPAGRSSCQEGVWQPWGGRRGPCRLLTWRSVGGSAARWWNSAHAAPQRTLWLLRTNGPRWGLQPSLPML